MEGYRCSGSLWEGRSKSGVVQVEDDLRSCQRDIELNPVRAGMVTDHGQYRWSSDRAGGLGQTDLRRMPFAAYLSLGKAVPERCQADRAFFQVGHPAQLRETGAAGGERLPIQQRGTEQRDFGS